MVASAVTAQDIVSVRNTPARPKEDSLYLDSMKYVPHRYAVRQMQRGYDDRITVRWMPDEYIPFIYGTKYGYTVTRTEEGADADTLVSCLKPLTREQFIERFDANDSIAAAAVQTVYGRSVGIDQTEAPPGSMGSLMEVYEQQQELFGFAALIADMRPDLAEAMGLAFVDRTARKGVKYTYTVTMNLNDSILPVDYGYTLPVALGDYKPEMFDVEITDSVTAPTKVILAWPLGRYSTYIIERRSEHESAWKRLDNQDYLSLRSDGDSDMEMNRYVDVAPDAGTYEYRVSARDLFGDISLPSQPHRVIIPDLIPPKAPDIYHIEILRQDSTIHARLDLRRVEPEPDLVGYVPVYRNEKLLGDKWLAMTKDIVAPGDTTILVDVTGLPTGQITIAAIDTAQNVGYGMPHEIRITDLKAPGKPTNLRYDTNAATGEIRLAWDAPEDLDIAHYDLYFANDLTHEFMAVKGTKNLNDTVFVDTVTTTVNQKYIYYKVRAVDFSTNQGEWSDVLQVIRPTAVKPSVAHIDSLWQDDAVHMRWIVGAEAQMTHHRVYRRTENGRDWTLIADLNADSVKANGFVINVNDRPKPYRGRYEYAVESFVGDAKHEVSSGLSLLVKVRFRGYRNFDCPVTLYGEVTNPAKNETTLAWEVTGQLPDYDNWYYCVYRQGPKDAAPKYLLSAPKGELKFTDFLIRPGETAKYYITVIMPGVGESKPSNIVTVSSKK